MRIQIFKVLRHATKEHQPLQTKLKNTLVITDESFQRLTVPILPAVGVLGVWLSVGADVVNRLLSCLYSSSKKWTSVRCRPFLAALGGLFSTQEVIIAQA